MTASISRSFWGASAAQAAFSLAPAVRTSCWRSTATSATSDPVLPRPRIRRFMNRSKPKAFNREGREERPQRTLRNPKPLTQRSRSRAAENAEEMLCDLRVISAFSALNAVDSVLREYLRVQVREKCFVQAPDHFGHFVLFDHERQINFGRALRDHADFLVRKLAEYQRRHSRLVPQVLAHQADDGLAAFVFYVGEFGEIGGQGGNGLIRIDRHRNAHFGSRNHIHGDFVAVEGLENRAQESVGQQHAGRGHVHDGDALLDGDGFEDVFALGSTGGDARAFARRIARVQNIDWNVFLDGGQHGRGMEDFRSKVCEFGRLVEADDLNAAGVGTDSGIGGENAVHVSPDLDAVRAEAGAKNSGGKIRTAASDRGSDAGSTGANESTHDRHFAGVQKRLNLFLKTRVGFFELRNRLHVVTVGDQDFARVHIDAVQVAGSEGGGDDLGRQHLAEGGDMIGGAGCDLD